MEPQILKNPTINDIVDLNNEYRQRIERLVKDANKYAVQGNKEGHKDRSARIDVLVTVIKDLEELITK
jgi:hypothetical protein